MQNYVGRYIVVSSRPNLKRILVNTFERFSSYKSNKQNYQHDVCSTCPIKRFEYVFTIRYLYL